MASPNREKRKFEKDIESPVKQVAITVREKLQKKQKGKIEIDVKKLDEIIEDLTASSDPDDSVRTRALSKILELFDSKLNRKRKKLLFQLSEQMLRKLG